jgi:protein-tyrosine-phosphatase
VRPRVWTRRPVEVEAGQRPPVGQGKTTVRPYPIFPGQVNRHHWPFEDPAHATGTDAEKLAVFRRVRDEIRRVFEAYAAGRLDQAKQA